MNDQTKAVIASMLCENTGRQMCDSGDAYGRAWQRNQGKTVADFEKEPEATLEIDRHPYDVPTEISFNVTLSAYHWLVARVTFEGWLQEAFDAFVEASDRDTSYFGLATAFLTEYLPTQYLVWDQGPRLATAEEIASLTGPAVDEDAEWQLNEDRRQLNFEPVQVGGPWRDHDKPMTVNTYNGEDSLSTILQYTLFTLGEDSEVYCALFVHGGCDARAGYTAPKFFGLGGRQQEWTGFLDNARYSIGAFDIATGTSARWDYAGNRFESGEWNCHGQPTQMLIGGGEAPQYGRLNALEKTPFRLVDRLPAEPEGGVLYVKVDYMEAWCPHTHQPLVAWPCPAG